MDTNENGCTKMDKFTVSSKVFACLQGMCQVLSHFVQYNTAECVHKYIFEMSDLIDSLVYGDGLI